MSARSKKKQEEKKNNKRKQSDKDDEETNTVEEEEKEMDTDNDAVDSEMPLPRTSPAPSGELNSSSRMNTSPISTNLDSEFNASLGSDLSDQSFKSSPRVKKGIPKPKFTLFGDIHSQQDSTSPITKLTPGSVSPEIRKENFNENANQTSMNNLRTFLSALAVVVSVVIFYLVIYLNSGKSATVDSPNQFDTFVQSIDNFKLLFPAQEKRFWRTVKASGKHVLNVSDPIYPAILLFVSNSKPAHDQFDAGSCLARKVSAEFDAANMALTSGSPIVDVGKLTTASSQQQKKEFDEKLQQVLESDYKSVIVEHLELLSPSAALLLHGYCDNDNAPYKDVMIILVLHVENDDISPQNAETLLKQSWERELETDKVDALMSRVANNIVIVRPESISSSSHCY